MDFPTPQNRWKIWGLFLIVLSFMVWITYHLGYTYIRLVTQAKPTPSQVTSRSPSKGEAQIRLSKLDFWTCQAGVFQSEVNAKQEKKHLDQLGWEPQIIGQKPWIVSIGFGHEQGELASIHDLLKEGGVETIIKHITLPEQAYRITGEGADQTAQILQAVHDFLETTPGKRGEALSVLEKEIAMAWPQKLDKLQQATSYVLNVEKTLGEDQQRLAVLRLLNEYQITLNSLQG